MSKALTYQDLVITSAGETFLLDVNSAIDIYLIRTDSTVTLLGNVSISYSGTPFKAQEFRFLYTGSIIPINNIVTIFGTQLPNEQLLFQCEIKAIFNGYTWDILILRDSEYGNKDINGNDIIDRSIITSKIADRSITLDKLDYLDNTGYLIKGGISTPGSGGAPASPNGGPIGFNASQAGYIVMGNGTDVASQPISGDATLNGDGVLTIGNGKITPNKLSFTITSYLEATLSIPSASILTLNTIPIDIIANPGTGKYIEIISATSNINFVSSVYTTNTVIQLINNGSDTAQLQDTSILTSSLSKITKFKDATSSTSGQTQILPNTSLQVKIATGNPTVGNSDIIIKVLYRIVTV